MHRFVASIIVLALLSAVAAPLAAGPCCAKARKTTVMVAPMKCCGTHCKISRSDDTQKPKAVWTAVAPATALEPSHESGGYRHRSPKPAFANPPHLPRSSPLLI